MPMAEAASNVGGHAATHGAGGAAAQPLVASRVPSVQLGTELEVIFVPSRVIGRVLPVLGTSGKQS